jgi:hypothetical protein
MPEAVAATLGDDDFAWAQNAWASWCVAKPLKTAPLYPDVYSTEKKELKVRKPFKSQLADPHGRGQCKYGKSPTCALHSPHEE